jgi:hypothetical protein
MKSVQSISSTGSRRGKIASESADGARTHATNRSEVMDQTQTALIEMMRKLYHRNGASPTNLKDYLTRPVACTPYLGNKGRIAG